MQGKTNLEYVKELIKRYENSIKTIKNATDPADISEQERQIAPVLRELQMAVPRICDDLVKISRKRRQEISEGI